MTEQSTGAVLHQSSVELGHDGLSKHSRKRQRKRYARSHPWSFAMPALAVFGVFFLTPTLLIFFYPFTNWSAFHEGIQFTGLTAFRDVLSDGTLVQSLKITLVFGVLVTIIQNLAGLLLALLLEADTRLNRGLRVVFFLPTLFSALAVGYVFQALLTPNGAVNAGLGLMVGHPVTIAWLGNTTWTLVVVAFIHSWKWMGLTMLVYLAGLKSVPEELLEAAHMDGSGYWRKFTAVKFPLLAPALTFNVTLALLGTLNSFDVVLATTGGGPAGSTEIFNVYMFRLFGLGLYGQAAAISLVLFLVVMIIAIPLVAYLRRREVAL